MDYPNLFKRGKIGPLEVPNRIALGPTSIGYCVGMDDRWWPSERHIYTYTSWARSGIGLLIHAHMKVECEIDKEGTFSSYVVLDRDDWTRTLQLISETVHRYGQKIVVQLSAGCGRIAALTPGHQPVGPSPNPCLFDPNVLTRELSIGEIERIVEAYGKAAARLEHAEYDGIVLHCLSQLFDQFISPLWNRREDKYGGDIDGRMRFVMECIDSVRSQTSRNFAIIAGMVSDYKPISTDVLWTPGMAAANVDVEVPELDYSIQVAKKFEEAGVHGLYVRAGGYHSPSWLVPPMYMEDACSVDLMQPIRKADDLPIIVDGKIRVPEVGERVIKEGKADYVGISRPILADPEWPMKARSGRRRELRQCIACNECILRLRSEKALGCTVNPALGMEWDCDVSPAPQARKVLIIGGGPGGMQAAVTAAQRGHEVTVWEKTNQLGGHVIEAAKPDFKKNFSRFIGYLKTNIKHTGVVVEMEKEADLQSVIGFKPDVVIVATGSKAVIPDVPGIELNHVTTAIEVLRGQETAGEKVAIIGGNEIGTETGLFLAQQGKKVTIIRRASVPKPDDVGSFNIVALMELIHQFEVDWITDTDIKEIQPYQLVLANKKDGTEHKFEADSVVIARELVSDNRLYYELEGNVPELHLIGDAVKPRRIWEAVHEGFNLARVI